MNQPVPHRLGALRRATGRTRQRGLVLIVALVVLGLMSLAGIGVLRATDTGNVIAGNFSFQQAAVQASDRALTDAVNILATLVVANAGNTAVANRYLPIQATALDARGMPSAVDWSAVTCTNPIGAIVDCDVDDGTYRVQYVVERMCSANPDLGDIASIRAVCQYEFAPIAGGSPSAANTPLRYRVLMRVRGPRGTEGWFEAMVSGPAST